MIKTVESRILTERLYIIHHNEIYLGMTPLKKLSTTHLCQFVDQSYSKNIYLSRGADHARVSSFL